MIFEISYILNLLGCFYIIVSDTGAGLLPEQFFAKKRKNRKNGIIGIIQKRKLSYLEICVGLTNAEIAEKVSITLSAVKYQAYSIY